LPLLGQQKKAGAFLEGISFELITNHKPLKPILENYSLSDIDNKQPQRLKMKVNHMQFTIWWIPGKENVEVSALSRAPIHRATPDDEIDEDSEINAVEICLNHDDGLEENNLDAFAEELQETAQKDEDHKTVTELATKNSWPEVQEQCPAHLNPYWRIHNDFSIEDGLLLHDGRFVVSLSLRKRYMDRVAMLHSSPEKMV